MTMTKTTTVKLNHIIEVTRWHVHLGNNVYLFPLSTGAVLFDTDTNKKTAVVDGSFTPCYNGEPDGFGLYVYRHK